MSPRVLHQSTVHFLHKMSSLQNLVFLTLVALSLSELVKYEPCYYKGEVGKHCQVRELNITPCPEAADDEPCRIKRGKPGSIAFKFTLDFDPVKKLKSRAYWATGLVDLPFAGMDTDVCHWAKCPVTENVETVYNFTMLISEAFIPNKFNIKWKLWEEDAEKEKECCIMFKMKLV